MRRNTSRFLNWLLFKVLSWPHRLAGCIGGYVVKENDALLVTIATVIAAFLVTFTPVASAHPGPYFNGEGSDLRVGRVTSVDKDEFQVKDAIGVKLKELRAKGSLSVFSFDHFVSLAQSYIESDDPVLDLPDVDYINDYTSTRDEFESLKVGDIMVYFASYDRGDALGIFSSDGTPKRLSVGASWYRGVSYKGSYLSLPNRKTGKGRLIICEAGRCRLSERYSLDRGVRNNLSPGNSVAFTSGNFQTMQHRPGRGEGQWEFTFRSEEPPVRHTLLSSSLASLSSLRDRLFGSARPVEFDVISPDTTKHFLLKEEVPVVFWLTVHRPYTLDLDLVGPNSRVITRRTISGNRHDGFEHVTFRFDDEPAYLDALRRGIRDFRVRARLKTNETAITERSAPFSMSTNTKYQDGPSWWIGTTGQPLRLHMPMTSRKCSAFKLNWGDGSPPVVRTQPEDTADCQYHEPRNQYLIFSHRYPSPGRYVITFTSVERSKFLDADCDWDYATQWRLGCESHYDKVLFGVEVQPTEARPQKAASRLAAGR